MILSPKLLILAVYSVKINAINENLACVLLILYTA